MMVRRTFHDEPLVDLNRNQARDAFSYMLGRLAKVDAVVGDPACHISLERSRRHLYDYALEEYDQGQWKTTWEPTSTSTSTATPCFRAEILGSEPPGTPQIQQVYVAMNPLLVYTLALMHLPAFYIPRASGKTTWEPVSTSTPTATPCFRAEILGSEPPGTPQIQQVYVAMNPLLVYTLALMHLPAFYIFRGSGKTTWEPTSTSTPTATPCFRVEISGF
ncbi:hypothetical protein THAOC_06799 [Thalassiosira oceanica]|uniref:Uncharacterized protein n=1 Tax=Thalassiosira oceanica TaxID=159749 RepID=K0T3S1_THAOC|nr:hypothetical protein THAOC_06799 [Thalassiosira oceanica]|eukprot:EJK71734.1 hypothetical protein THAOC_06799 [Thalassiosira oceanica]